MKRMISQAVAITLVFAQSVFFFPVKLSSVEVQFVKFPYYFNTYPDGLDIITQNVIDEALESVIRHVETETLEVYVPQIAPSESKMIVASEGGVVELEEARIVIPPGALEEDTQISITRLFSTQDTGEGIKNATIQGGGYRFLPAGTQFVVPVTIEIGYDTLLSESAKDTLYTYYYDTKEQRWIQLERHEVNENYVISYTTHFTDMINGTLSLPEGPSPLSFNINSIKGLEAADPSTGVSGLEGLSANNTGEASFSIGLDLPPGRAGMAPRVAIGYSSGSTSGVMGRGFNLSAGSSITTDTRWGVPRFNSRVNNVNPLLRDTYLLDGVMLEEQSRTSSVITYRPLRESSYLKIERFIREGALDVDYWVVTDTTGTKRIYGKNDNSWNGIDGNKKYIWEIEEVQDVFGNTVRYEYEKVSGHLYIDRIVYTGHVNNTNMAAYSVEFEYESGRKDVRVDGRGGFDSRIDRLLKGISVNHLGNPVFSYAMEYEQNMFGASQLVSYGLLRTDNTGDYLWSYGFEYEKLEGEMFGSAVMWKGVEGGIHVQTSVSGGSQGSVGAGVGIGPRDYPIDFRINGGGTWSSSKSETETRQMFIDLDGDGLPDSVTLRGGVISVQRNTGRGFENIPVVWEGKTLNHLGREKGTSATTGFNLGAGVGAVFFNIGLLSSVVNQKGWSDLDVGFADIDGDGLVDIIIKGDSRYFKNVSDARGIRFRYVDIPVAQSFTMPQDLVPALTAEERKELENAFYQEAPLRQWRASEKGSIRITQDVRAAGVLSNDGIVARTFFYDNDTTETIRTVTLNRYNTRDGGSDEITIEKEGQSLYFLSDAKEFVLEDAIDWSVSIEYESMRYFGDFNLRMRYVPPVGLQKTAAALSGDILRPLYNSGNPWTLSNRDWESEFNNGDKDRKYDAWREIVRLGWFVPGVITADNFKAIWELAGKKDDDYRDPYRDALITYYQYHAGSDSFIRNERLKETLSFNEWRAAENRVNTLIKEIGAVDISYFDKLAAYTIETEAGSILVYPVPNEDTSDYVYVKNNYTEVIQERKEGSGGYVYRHNDRNLLVVDVFEGQEFSIEIQAGLSFTSTELSNNIEITSPFSSGSSIPYYINRQQAGTTQAIIANDRTEITFPVRNEGTSLYDLVYEFTNFNPVSRYLLDSDVQRIDDDDFVDKYYEQLNDGRYVLRSEYNNIPNSLPVADLIMFASYKELLEKSNEYALSHYSGSFTKKIYYYGGGMYDIQNGGAKIPVLEAENGFKYRTAVNRVVSWDSGKDFSNENRQPYSYKLKVIDPASLSGNHFRRFLNSNIESEIDKTFERIEILGGGVNNWYYAIWLGNQEVNPFDASVFGEKDSFYDDFDLDKQEEIVNEQQRKIEEGEITDKDKQDVYYMPFMTVEQAKTFDPGKELYITVNGRNETVSDNALVGTISRSVYNSIQGEEVITVAENYFAYINGNRIHTNRAGGMSYYNIPGLVTPASTSGVMPAVRKSQNNGVDRTTTTSLGLSVSGELAGILKGAQVVKMGIDIGMSRNKGTNTSTSRVYQSVQSITGSSTADILQAQDGNIVVTEGSRAGFTQSYTIENIDNLGINTSDIKTYGTSLSVSGSVTPNYTSGGKNNGVSMNGGGGGSFAQGINEQTAGFIDINGDGLPDYVTRSGIIMNLGRENFQDNLLDGFDDFDLNRGTVETIGFSVPVFPVGFGRSPDANNSASTLGAGFNINAGFNYSASISETESMLMDINADGLVDMVKAESGKLYVRYNLGDRFDDDWQEFTLPSWGLTDEHINAFLRKTDVDLLTGMFGDLPMAGDVGKETGVNGLFSGDVSFNPFGSDIEDYLNKLETNTSFSSGFNASGNIYGLIRIPILFVAINIKLDGGGGYTTGASANGVSMRMMDMSGDGLPDRVLRVPGTDYLFVQPNLTGRVGLLRKVELPQGGAYLLDYDLVQGTVDSPGSRYVLSELTVIENSGSKNLLNPNYTSVNEYTTRFTYSNGFYDRNNKESYGFGIVTTRQVDRFGNTLGYSETVYYNRDYHLKGMARSAFVYNGHEVVRKVDTIADVAPYSRYIMERKEVRELLGDGSFVFSESRFEYDRFGNVTRLEERANAVETITVDIRYWNNSSLNLHSHPEEITVRGLQTGLLRKRIGVYNNNGTMRELTQMLNESRSSADSTSTLLWDTYGNLSSITDPNGAYVSYRYDLRFNQFVEEIITGGRGITPYRSYIDWDTALVRKTKETDMSGNSINYVYDSYGRLEEVWSPYDRFGQGGSTPAVRYEYFNPLDSNWYAITQNKIQFDSNNNDTLTTVVMTDGLGRALYTAKQGEVWNNGYTKKGWNVSGFVSYDGKGRTTEAGQPLFVDILRAEDLVNWNLRDRNLMINPTVQEYDNLDRVTKVTLPAAHGETRPVQTTRYEMRNGNTVTIATDPLFNVSEQTVDSRGNITLIRRLDSLQRELTRATYRYNPLGEMLAAFDADGNPLTVEYDRLGRRVRMTSADIGVKNWQYDPAGNLIAEWDSQLASLGRRINYTYDGLNRLTRINYPFSEDTVYEYGDSSRTDNSAGRVTKLIDETGFTTYTYGMLGQVEEERRTIKLLPLSSGLTKEAVMRYTSDYLGRMQEIIYPDGERLRYEYNYGGQITKVTGLRQNTTFNYVNNIGYDEYSQRVYIEYGSGVKSYYSYDEHRRWLSTVRTENQNKLAYQNLSYEFDAVGNVLSYTNTSDGHTTTQNYSYDGLYQLIQAQGSSRSHPYGPTGATEYTTTYKQDFTFNRIGNMTNKLSESVVSTPNRLGDNLNYNLDYDYVQGTRKASRIGNRHYSYDLNGNLIAERDGSNAVNPESYRPYYQDGDLYWTDYGFGVTRPQTQTSTDGVYQRNYRWNERNLLSESSDSAYTVQYRYGADGQRAIKYVLNNRRSTLYFNKMWQTNDSRAEWVQSKHIYLGEQRILTKYNSEGNNNTQAERERIYYYHSDHLGSAQTITNHIGQLHERIEYTPYGELWIDWKNLNSPGDGTPFRFTGKELDEETGLYYYGARYLDPRISRWLSVDPAMYEGDYLPSAPVSDETRQRNQNLPGMGGIYNYVNMHVYHYGGNNPVKHIDPDGRISGFVTNENAVAGAGHSGLWVEIYDNYGNSKGFAFFEVNPIDERVDSNNIRIAHENHGGRPLSRWQAVLGGSIGGSSIGSSSGVPGGASVGSISGVISNEAVILVGVNQYRFDTREQMEIFIADRWKINRNEIRETVFNTSITQDFLILQAAISKGNSFGRYDILTNNCAQYASRVLSAGGIKTSNKAIPIHSHNYIDTNNRNLIR